ncbi:hypothetical protein EAH87_04415 [Sphingomonas koreensis]|nr:hypothetical protein EAH87_04415 [Sphingomonas koreensis]
MYLADPFHQLKRVQPHRRLERRNMLRSTREGITSAIAVRAGELQSRLGLRDMVFGVGDFGRQLRQQWWATVSASLPQRDDGATLQDTAALWQRLYPQLPAAAEWCPPEFTTRSSRYQAARG